MANIRQEYEKEIKTLHQKKKDTVSDKLSKEMVMNKGNRNSLVNSVMKMAMSIANKFGAYSNVVEYEDILQSSMLGATYAADKWLSIPISKRLAGTRKFSTFAYPWIAKYAREELKQNASILTYKPTQFGDMLDNTRTTSGDDLDKTTGNTVFATGKLKELKEVQIARSEIKELQKAGKLLFRKLSGTDKKILFAHYGIGVEDPMTVREIAAMTGKSVGTVHRIIQSSLSKVKADGNDPAMVEYFAFLAGVDVSTLPELTLDN